MAKSICNQKDINEKSKILRTFYVCVCVLDWFNFILISHQKFICYFLLCWLMVTFSHWIEQKLILKFMDVTNKSFLLSHLKYKARTRRSFNLDLVIKRILSVNYAVYQRYNKLKPKKKNGKCKGKVKRIEIE